MPSHVLVGVPMLYILQSGLSATVKLLSWGTSLPEHALPDRYPQFLFCCRSLPDRYVKNVVARGRWPRL